RLISSSVFGTALVVGHKLPDQSLSTTSPSAMDSSPCRSILGPMSLMVKRGGWRSLRVHRQEPDRLSRFHRDSLSMWCRTHFKPEGFSWTAPTRSALEQLTQPRCFH